MSQLDHYRHTTLCIMGCMFLLSEDGQNVDLVELDELVRTKYNLTTEEADTWFADAEEDGAISEAPPRLAN